jgi:amino acid transporter
MTLFERSKRWVFGKPRDIEDPSLFHRISLIPFLAWVGLGADGLSSSAYGPDEAFRALGEHQYLAVFLAAATALTVFIISYAYSRIIEHFPAGGGGYVVASKLLGPAAGVVSGCALLVDYALTISVSIASGGDQIFSFLPLAWHAWKLPLEIAAIVLMLVLNIRGVKDSILTLVPVFLLFVATHAVVLLGAVALHLGEVPAVISHVASGVHSGFSALGLGAMFLIFAKAYSRGAGTYTGIEAVSNGIQTMREPKVATAKRTMVYMSTSLAVTAGGILLCYLLLGVQPEEGKTLNAVMVERLHFGGWFVVLTLASEAALLFVAGQAGFIDGPRVMANMAMDSWLPRRFSALSDRLTMHYGVVLMGIASIITLIYTKGAIDTLVTMYSINVFITFSLTELGMCRFWITHRSTRPEWKRALPVHATGLTLCLSILTTVIIEKFGEGGWITIIITLVVIGLCVLIKRHYRTVARKLDALSTTLANIPEAQPLSGPTEIDLQLPTAVLLVGGYSGLGIHSLQTIFWQFPDYFKQIAFVSVAVIDSGNFKGAEEIEHLKEQTQKALEKYVALARSYGLGATSYMSVGTEAVAEAEDLCKEIAQQFPRAIFFAGKLIFRREKWYQRLLHNETAHAIQRRLQWEGLATIVLPVRVHE